MSFNSTSIIMNIYGVNWDYWKAFDLFQRLSFCPNSSRSIHFFWLDRFADFRELFDTFSKVAPEVGAAAVGPGATIAAKKGKPGKGVGEFCCVPGPEGRGIGGICSRGVCKDVAKALGVRCSCFCSGFVCW